MHDTKSLRLFYHQRNFESLCACMTHFLQQPSLHSWRCWKDLFFEHDDLWNNDFLEYHRSNPTQGSRAIVLLLTHRHILYIRGSYAECPCNEQSSVLKTMTLATYGLLQCFQIDPKYRSFYFVMTALLQTLSASSFHPRWRAKIIPQLDNAWREIFFWSQIEIVQYHSFGSDIVYNVLAECIETERLTFSPLIAAYLSTDEELSSSSDAVSNYSTNALSGDMFALDMVDYHSELKDPEKALAWIEMRLDSIAQMVSPNEWLSGAMAPVFLLAPKSDLMRTLIVFGKELHLQSAAYYEYRVSGSSMVPSLFIAADRGHVESMVELYENTGDDRWLIRAATAFNSKAMHLCGTVRSNEGIRYLNNAVQRMYGPAFVSSVEGVSEGVLRFQNNTVALATAPVSDNDRARDVAALIEKSRYAGDDEQCG